MFDFKKSLLGDFEANTEENTEAIAQKGENNSIENKPLAEYYIGLGGAKLIIYPERIVIAGITNSKDIPINHISNIEVKKWTSKIVIHTTAGKKEEIILGIGTWKVKVGEIEELINSLIAKSKKSELPRQRRESSLDDLEKLAELKEKGIITQEEFDKKKKEILS